MTDFNPTGDRVLIRPIPEDTQVGSIIVVREDSKPQRGSVLAVGRDVKAVSMGYTAYFSKFSGTAITLNGEELLILRENDLLGYE